MTRNELAPSFVRLVICRYSSPALSLTAGQVGQASFSRSPVILIQKQITNSSGRGRNIIVFAVVVIKGTCLTMGRHRPGSVGVTTVSPSISFRAVTHSQP